MNAHIREIEKLLVSTDEKYLLSTSKDGSVRLWDLNSETLLVTRVHNLRNPIISIYLSNEIFTVNSRDECKVWLLDGTIYPFNKPYTHCISLKTQPKLILLSENNGYIHTVQTQSYTPLRLTEMLYEFYTVSITVSPNEKFICQFCIDNTIRLWKTENNKQIAWLKGHESFIKGIRFNENETHALTFSNDNTIRIWDWRTGGFSIIKTDPIDDVYFSDNSIYSFHSNTIRIWKNTIRIIEIPAVQFSYPYCVTDNTLYTFVGMNLVKLLSDKFIFIRENFISIGTKILVKNRFIEAKKVTAIATTESFIIVGLLNGTIRKIPNFKNEKNISVVSN